MWPTPMGTVSHKLASCSVSQRKSDMCHSKKVSRREVLPYRACHCASKVEGGTCSTIFIMLASMVCFMRFESLIAAGNESVRR